MSNIKDLSLEILETEDGSPTLLLPNSQPMHSMVGALSETLEIYAPVARKSLEGPQPRILSLGLGLGYNEIMMAAMAVQLQQKEYELHSFESLLPLTMAFQAWLEGRDSQLSSCYEKILSMVCRAFKVEASPVKNLLKKIVFHDALGSENKNSFLFHGVFYDAFSSVTSPELWTEEHIDLFLKNFCAPQCFFSTYASTGILQRSLKANNFSVEVKKGFGKKRESIFAYR